ncbi:hypothetical protein DMC30DRAFT_417355 [Rhodotorula diobovata]|uniref:Uncharacterized protein n=1 Tax=Rhodotorula diobovata TaxID=5288 RepID=A0A5C5FSZ0_9BASI|nr:hypothetical protein DMC30DRAFT_417355 [Rhodotorula diobovata]
MALRAVPLARPCLCRSPFPSPSSLRLISSSAPVRSPLLASTTPSTLLHRATAPIPTAPGPLGQVRGFKTPKSMRRKASPLARNGNKTARKHSARAAKRRRQRAKKIN